MTITGRESQRLPDVLTWGILSTARINAELLPGFKTVKRSRLAAIASRDIERAKNYAQSFRIPKAYGSYEELLADDEIQCVYISLPNGLHGEWIGRALDAGKHVLCEKPLTPSAEEATQLFALAETRGLVLAEAFMYRHHPKIKKVRQVIESGRIGDPHTVRAAFNFRIEKAEGDIRFNKALAGGALNDVGCYCVNFATFVTQEPAERGLGFAQTAHTGVDQRFYGLLSFPSGTVAHFDCAIDSGPSVCASVVGERGELVVPMPWYAHLPPQQVRIQTGEQWEDIPARGANAYFLEVQDFLASVRGEKTPEVSASETIRNLRVIELLRDSAGIA